MLGKKEGQGRWSGSWGLMGGERLNSMAMNPQDRAGQGKEMNPKLNYLLDFLCTPELQGRKDGREKKKKKNKIKEKN